MQLSSAQQTSSLSHICSCRPLQAVPSRKFTPARQARRSCQTKAQAGSKAPKGVTEPPQKPATPPAWFGFVDNAERQNSRAAMIGFFSLLILEFVAKKGILEMVGLKVGGGLGFEF